MQPSNQLDRQTGAQPASGGPLRIAIRQFADFEGALDEQTAAFCAATGAPAPVFRRYDLHGLHDALFEERGLADGGCDLALFSTDWLGEAMAADLLEELTPHLAPGPNHPGTDWPDGWPSTLVAPVTRDGHCYAIPWHDGPEALLYRADLFNDPATQAAYQRETGRTLAPPRTWDEFLSISRFFTRPEKRQWGTLVAAYPDGHNTLYDLTLQLWSRGGDWTDPGKAPGQVEVRTQAMADALAFYRTLVTDPALCHPRSPELASTETGDIFIAGEVAMMVNWFGFAARSDREGSPLRGRVALAPIPSDDGTRSVSLCSYWVFGIAKGSPRKAEAAALLRFLMRPEQDTRVLAHGPVSVRLSSWRDPAVHTRYPLMAQLESLSLGARSLPRSPDLARLAALADHLTQKAITTDEPIETILAGAEPMARALRL